MSFDLNKDLDLLKLPTQNNVLKIDNKCLC